MDATGLPPVPLPGGRWTKRSLALDAAALLLFGVAIALLRDGAIRTGQLGAACLFAAPLAGALGLAFGIVALRRKESKGLAWTGTVVGGVLAAFFALFIVLLIEAIRNFT